MKFTRIKLNLKLVLLPVILLLFSCSQTGPGRALQTQNFIAPLPADCWLRQPVTYKLRQSAELEYLDKKEFFEGFMELDLKQHQAHLVIFTALGVTLLNLEIKPGSFTFADSSSHNRREQRFAAAVAGSVQKIFFSFINCSDPGVQLQLNLRKSSGAAEFMQIHPKGPHPDWMVSYADYRDYSGGRLPERIILQNHRPEFKLTLWLHQAEIKTGDAQ